MPDWLPIPPNFPVHGSLCSVRRLAWPSAPFEAVYNASAGLWVEQTTGLTIPWYDVARYALADSPQPPEQLVVTGTTSPDRSGIYEIRGMFYGQPYYQRGSDSMFCCWVVSNTEWMLYQFPRTAVADRHSTKIQADPTSVVNSYTPYGTCTGTAIVVAA